VAALVSRNIGFFTVAATNSQIQRRSSTPKGSRGSGNRRDRDGEARDGSAVCELTPLVDLSSWPELTRSSCDESLFTPAPNGACSPRSSTATGALHRPGRGPGRPRCHHAGPCPCREPHRAAEGVRPVPLPVQRLRGERELDDDRAPRCRPRPLFQLLCFEGYWQGARPKALRWAFSTRLGDSSHQHGAGSSASSTGGRPPRISLVPTDGSSSSPERSRSALLAWGRPVTPEIGRRATSHPTRRETAR